MVDWRDRVHEEEQDRDAAHEASQDAIADRAAALKPHCRVEIIRSPELWNRWVRDYGTVMTDDEYALLDEAARLACAMHPAEASALVRRAWARSLDLGADDMALSMAEQEWASNEWSTVPKSKLHLIP